VKTDIEISRPDMPDDERLARMIARGEGHNDHEGMHWEKYIYTARLILRHTKVTFEK